MIVLDFIRQHMPAGWKHTPSGWISGNCPMCSQRGHNPDKRGRGGIRLKMIISNTIVLIVDIRQAGVKVIVLAKNYKIYYKSLELIKQIFNG